jgi:hypothetical protein
MNLKKIINTDIYEFHASSSLTEEDAKRLTQSFEEFESREEKIKLLGVVDEISWPKGIKGIRELISTKINASKAIAKYAIVSENKWINDWVPIGNFFTPNLPIKAFSKGKRQEAIDWLNEDKVKEYDSKDYLANIDIKKTQENTFEIVVSQDEINHASMSAIYDIFDKVEKGKKINLLLQLDSIPSFENFETLMEGLEIDLKVFGRLNKYAVVSDAKWVEGYSRVGDFYCTLLFLNA